MVSRLSYKPRGADPAIQDLSTDSFCVGGSGLREVCPNDNSQRWAENGRRCDVDLQVPIPDSGRQAYHKAYQTEHGPHASRHAGPVKWMVGVARVHSQQSATCTPFSQVGVAA